MADEKYDSSECSGSDDADEPSWISWFTSLRGNEFFCEVDEDYIQDDFNLTGLGSIVPYYEFALDSILDCDSPNAVVSEEHQELIETAAEMLYGLIHARFILTNRGLAAMATKFSSHEFGRCPRVHCESQAVLPVGESDLPRNSTVRVFCPRCENLYVPRSTRQANIDGAYFGTTFAHLIFQIYPELMPSPPEASYVPRIYGFKIHAAAKDRIIQAKKKAKKALKESASPNP
eukprot:c21541_g1_i1.p1 GENE.c21541_g1_i1~~c21541_g1_i1.p1  ORF type:complete len:242 (-),score=44.15 c21541_g1_i1:167-862(-)